MATKKKQNPNNISAICVTKKFSQRRSLNLYRQGGEVSYICIVVV